MRKSRIDKLVLAAKKQKGRKKWVRYCPSCKSTDVALDARMEMVWYRCRKCGFQSSSFPEKPKK